VKAVALAGLRAELRARDHFLAKAVSTLAVSALSLDRALRLEATLPTRVRNANAELQALLRELRILAEPAAPVPLRRRKLDLCSLLERFFADRAAGFARSGLAVSIHRTGSIFSRVDPGHIASMLDELLSNALKYRRARPVSVQISLARTLVTIRVTNHSGWVGPKPTYRRFKRGESKRCVPGFGVGLWLTRRLAEAHGGRFAIHATRGQTQAIIWLPAAASASCTSTELCATLVSAT
jgi:signal transduction histidine kinase